MILLSSPVFQLAAIVAGSAAPVAAPVVVDAARAAPESGGAAPLLLAPVAGSAVRAEAAAGDKTTASAGAAQGDAATGAIASSAAIIPAFDRAAASLALTSERAGSRLRLAQASPGVGSISAVPSASGGAEPAGDTLSAPADHGMASGAPAAPPADAPGAAMPAAAMPGTPTATAPDGGPMLRADESLIPGRRRPGVIPEQALPERITQENKGAVHPPPPEAFPEGSEFPIPDRWRLIKALCPDKNRFLGIEAVCHSRLDPYHQNFLKGDRPIDLATKPKWLPIHEDDWFFTLGGVSDTVVQAQGLPIPRNRQDIASPTGVDVFGRGHNTVLSQTFIGTAVLLKGSTAYMPPHVEYHLTLAYNLNYVDVQERRVLNVKPSKPTHRFDQFLGVQEAFIDYHIRNTSDRYDFDSVRVGIQPFNADFRGFLFQDNQLGIRLFGDRDNNRFQYNLAFFWRLEKDTNSGLNDLTTRPRKDYMFVGNIFRQDLPIPGLTSQFTAIYNMNREGGETHNDDNGFPVRPVLLGNLAGRNYDAVYLGYSTDGHIGRMNMTTSLYGVFGHDTNNLFTGKPAKIRGYFGAAELSYDINWIRLRLSGVYASGDKKPFDNTETGFDSIFENPIVAGADTSFLIRQAIPFAGGGRVVNVSQPNGLLFDLRSSKDEGQSNFNNPGTMLLGIGGDFDLTPKFRLSANVNHAWFQNTKTLRVLRTEGTIPKSFGWDYSLAAIYRPKMIQNVVFRLSAAALQTDKGFRDLFTNASKDKFYYSVLFNVILAY